MGKLLVIPAGKRWLWRGMGAIQPLCRQWLMSCRPNVFASMTMTLSPALAVANSLFHK